MPPDGPNDHCGRHPGVVAVATCDECGTAVCLDCAIPVRGRVLDAPCLGLDPQPPLPRSRVIPAPWAGVGFVVALLASVLPWRKYGLGSGLFGAWGTFLRWSILAGLAAAIGLALWTVGALRPSLARGAWRIALRVCAVSVLLGALLHLLRPPIPGPQSYGATVAIVGALLALAGTYRPRAD